MMVFYAGLFVSFPVFVFGAGDLSTKLYKYILTVFPYLSNGQDNDRNNNSRRGSFLPSSKYSSSKGIGLIDIKKSENSSYSQDDSQNSVSEEEEEKEISTNTIENTTQENINNASIDANKKFEVDVDVENVDSN